MRGCELPVEARQRTFMLEALKVAEEALRRGELPIGAVLVCGDEVIARGSARDKELKQRIVHAEILALLELDRMKPFPVKRREVHLYTNLEPCMMCLGACLVTDVSQVFFGLESPTDGAAELYSTWDKQPADHVGCRELKVVGGVLREESRNLFRQFCELYPFGGYSDWARTLI
jgi:tRNA(adenine34) deaminase